MLYLLLTNCPLLCPVAACVLSLSRQRRQRSLQRLHSRGVCVQHYWGSSICPSSSGGAHGGMLGPPAASQVQCGTSARIEPSHRSHRRRGADFFCARQEVPQWRHVEVPKWRHGNSALPVPLAERPSGAESRLAGSADLIRQARHCVQ